MEMGKQTGYCWVRILAIEATSLRTVITMLFSSLLVHIPGFMRKSEKLLALDTLMSYHAHFAEGLAG